MLNLERRRCDSSEPRKLHCFSLMCAFFFFFSSQLLSHSLAPLPPPPPISFLLFISVLTQQWHNFMPGGAAEETEPFHVQWTVGLIQKKTDFFLARVKPICSCTEFLCTLSRQKLCGSGMASLKPPVSHRAVPAARWGGRGGCVAAHEAGGHEGQVPPRDVLG